MRPAGWRGRPARLPALLLFATVALVLSVGCGSDGSGSDEVPDASEPSAKTTEATPTPTRAASDRAATLCAAPAGEVLGKTASPDLVEISGLAASRTNRGVLWAHNDSGDAARIFGLSMQGEHLATYVLAGAAAIDWEDMAIGPGPAEGADYLYLADIGDNQAQRPEVAVYRVPEPAVEVGRDSTGQELEAVEKLSLRYPDKAHDAEVVLVDPVRGDLFIVTKEGSGNVLVFRAPGSLQADSTTTLERVGGIDFSQLMTSRALPPDAPPLARGAGHLPTAGDVSPDGDLIAIRTYSTVWVWARDPGSELWEAFSAAPCEGPSAIEAQGEAIAFDADGAGYITVSEGTNVPLHHFRSE